MINSCKKEGVLNEVVNSSLKEKNIELYNTPKITKISLNNFRKKVNPDLLGTLKDAFIETKSMEKLMSVNINEAYTGLELHTDSIKVLTGQDFTSYIFAVKSKYKYSTTFQNLTIVEKDGKLSSFITTYTPTKKWIRASKTKNTGKFEGKITFTPINLDGTTPLPNSYTQNSAIGKYLTSTSPLLDKVASMPVDCSVYPVYYDVPYKCSSGMHWPWEDGCTLFGPEAAGYGTAFSYVTVCDGSPGGGGPTSPTTPPDYEPCPSEPDPINFNGAFRERFASIPAPCDLNDDDFDEWDIRNKVEDPCLKGMVNDILLGEIDNDISLMIKSVFGQDASVNLEIRDVENLNHSRDATITSNYENSTLTNALIKLNKDVLPNSSKEYITSVILHEALHAYLHVNIGDSTINHEIMAAKYVTTMANILTTMYTNLSLNDALSLSWGGLKDTSSFPYPPSSANVPSNHAILNTNHRYNSIYKVGQSCN